MAERFQPPYRDAPTTDPSASVAQSPTIVAVLLTQDSHHGALEP